MIFQRNFTLFSLRLLCVGVVIASPTSLNCTYFPYIANISITNHNFTASTKRGTYGRRRSICFWNAHRRSVNHDDRKLRLQMKPKLKSMEVMDEYTCGESQLNDGYLVVPLGQSKLERRQECYGAACPTMEWIHSSL